MTGSLPDGELLRLLGVDIGGTKIAVAVVDAASGAVLARRVVPTPARSAVTGVIEAAADLAARVLAAYPAVAGGVGAPGIIDAEHGVVVVSTGALGRAWEGTAVAPELERRLGLPFAADNDVNAGALGEARWGAGRGLGSFLRGTGRQHGPGGRRHRPRPHPRRAGQRPRPGSGHPRRRGDAGRGAAVVPPPGRPSRRGTPISGRHPAAPSCPRRGRRRHRRGSARLRPAHAAGSRGDSSRYAVARRRRSMNAERPKPPANAARTAVARTKAVTPVPGPPVVTVAAGVAAAAAVLVGSSTP